jgi:hypothetical protein
MEPNVINSSPHKHTHCRFTNSRSPPLHYSFDSPQGNNCIGGVLPHHIVGSFDLVLSHCVACGCIAVNKLAGVKGDQEEVVG